MGNNDPIGNADWLNEFHIYESLPDGTVQVMADRYPDCDYDECDDESVLYYRHQCCNTVSLGCELHTHGFARFLIDLHQNGTFARCVFCKRYKAPLSLITRPQKLRLDAAA